MTLKYYLNDQGWNKINYNNKSIIYGYLYNNFTNIIKNIFKIKNKKKY